MKLALGRVIACVLLSGTVTACGSDSSGGGSGATGGGAGSGGSGAVGTGGSAAGGSGGSGATATGGSAGQVPCTLTVSGEVSGTADCTSSASSEAIAFGAEPAFLLWNTSDDVADVKVNYSFNYPNPVEVTTYEGGASQAPSCILQITSNDFTKNWLYNSASPTAGGNCSMTITSAVDDSSSSTTRYVIHGSGTATGVNTADQSTVTIELTF